MTLTRLILLLLLSSTSCHLMAGILTINMDGVNTEQKLNIRSFLSLQSLDGQTITNPSRLRYLHNLADEEIKTALQPLGFYQPTIQASLTKKGEDWLALYRIQPGKRLPISQLDIQLIGAAKDDIAFKQLLAKTTLRKGQPLIHSQYEQLKKQLSSLAVERGYYQAELTQHRVEVNLADYNAAITLHMDSGPRFSIGDITFALSPIDADFIKSYASFNTGDPIQNSQLIDLQSALIDSDYFQRVEVRPLWNQMSDTQVPIFVDLDANKKTKYHAGFGYGTDTGARTKLGVNKRWINRRGHQFNTQLLASEIITNFSAEYSIPGENPREDRYAVQLSLLDEDSDSINTRSHSIGVSKQQQRGRWQQVLALNYQQEESTFSGDTETSHFLIPQVNYNTVSTKDRLQVKNGYSFSSQLRGASQALISTEDFVQTRISGKGIYSITNKFRILARAEVGTTWVSDFDALPASLRFFTGGDNSVRGYDYKSLGPRDDSDDVIGGRNLLVGSVEVDYRLFQNWGVAAFIDSGNAFNDTDLSLYTGIGVGLRWFSPVGPVRFDLAVPQDDDDDNSIHLHFNLGADL
ncbi:autotransporter assembly complex family protein [Amphritea sp. 2_MG-2023]|uniref:autotransporter assembly complex protein TamA n=1 Tax=Amphritea TaxID=515417 RepID=UPI001C07179A|nr:MULTISPECIES: autotransporter assembly complex family protein [Amphritea]MBU2966485.1 autotransporter assembly complex protein TamA [Amphritea atlantica]MDO6417656.1 autotransporter assembly complex family protein [Amphritea sp. 2_MG-2023]